MAGPYPVRDIAVAIDGVTYEGTYYVQHSIVYVQYVAAEKKTQIGGSTPESLAHLLLSELVREELGLEAKKP